MRGLRGADYEILLETGASLADVLALAAAVAEQRPLPDDEDADGPASSREATARAPKGEVVGPESESGKDQ